MNKIDKSKPVQIVLHLGYSEDAKLVAQNISQLAGNMGYSQKRLFLIALAQYISTDSPELALKIVDLVQVDNRRRIYK